MIRKIQIFLLLCVAALGTPSCLEKYPDNAIPTDESLRTVEDINQAVLGIYAGFKSNALYSGYLTLCPDIQADLVYAVEGYSNTYGDIWRWDILADNQQVEAVYSSLYTIIGRCNFVLDNADRVRAATTDDTMLDALDDLLGETYFARALAYSELIKTFCKAYDPDTAAHTLGVVLSESYDRPAVTRRASLEASYEFVLNDLKRAAELLTQEAQPNGAVSAYFTTSAVNALYARVYLYMQNWEKAVEYATETIEDPALELASVNLGATSSQSLYQYMWTNDISSEVIWRVKFSPSSYGGALGGVFLNYDYTTFTPDYVPASWALNLYEANDRRYGIFFSTQTTGYAHRLTWPLLVKYLGNEQFILNRILHVNMPKVLRLSEQYLIRAEAYCRQGEYGKASKDISALRTKRYSQYGSASLTKENWLRTISDERVRELYMEGFRLNDLKRWGEEYAAVNDGYSFVRKPQLHSVEAGSSLKVKADNPLFVWPIPQHELNVPGSEIEPNDSNR